MRLNKQESVNNFRSNSKNQESLVHNEKRNVTMRLKNCLFVERYWEDYLFPNGNKLFEQIELEGLSVYDE